MSPWGWWWLEQDEPEHGGWQGDCDSREDAIRQANRDLPPGTKFEVMEARSSTAEKHEGSDCVPFLRIRNRESLVAGLQVVEVKRGNIDG